MENIILFGPAGAGKGAAAKIIKELYGNVVVSLGEKIHSECCLHGSHKREEMQAYGKAMREIFGEDVWNQYLFNRIHNNTANIGDSLRVVIEDGRTLRELEYWTNKGYRTIGILAEFRKRQQRILARSNYAFTDEMAKHETELQAMYIAGTKCDIVIKNNGTLDDLRLKLKESLYIYTEQQDDKACK